MKYAPKTGVVAFMPCVLFLVCACNMRGGGGYEPGFPVERAASMYSVPEAAMPTAGDFSETPALSLDPEYNAQSVKLIKRADLHIRVEDLQAVEKPLIEFMEKYNAWSASTGIYENYRNYSIRVPSSSYGAMLMDLTGLGRILSRSENAEDVTLRYYDLESRLATRRELLKTYQGYLAKANNIDEIMTVESRIADLQREIDQTGSQFRNLANLVDYSTIDLEISGPVNVSAHSRPTLGEKLGELFGSFTDVASSALVALTGIIIYGIPAIVILILLFWILFGRIGLLKKLWRLVAGKK